MDLPIVNNLGFRFLIARQSRAGVLVANHRMSCGTAASIRVSHKQAPQV